MKELIRISFHVVEGVALFLFLAGLIESGRRGRVRILEFVMIFFYGLLLEELDMRIFKTYHYGPHFFLMAGGVPVAIACLWAVILAGAMAISDSTGLPARARPFLDALLAVWLDLSLDAIAIRLGYWKWMIRLDEGWFGVPAGNLWAWMWVAFFYSASARIVRHFIQKNPRWALGYLAVPFISYAGLFASIKGLALISQITGLATQPERLYLFGAQFVIFLALVIWQKSMPAQEAGEAASPFWLISRFAIHLYFLGAFFVFGIFRKDFILGGVALGIMAAELVLTRHVKLTSFAINKQDTPEGNR